MPKENKRELILEGLENLLPGRRFHEITLDEVAKAAQVGKGTIYLYFKDKDTLFAELICYQLERLAGELAALENCPVDSLPDRVFELVGGFIQRHRAGFGAAGEAASRIANLSEEQFEKMRNLSSAVVDTLGRVMKTAVPEWSGTQSVLNARILLWLVDGFMRSCFAKEQNTMDSGSVLAFFRRGAGLN